MLKDAPSLWPNHSTVRYVIKRTEHTFSHLMCMVSLKDCFYITLKLEATQSPSTVKWMNKLWYIHKKEIYYSNENK